MANYPLFIPHQAAGTSHDLNDKFMTSAKFELTYGSLSLFYGGLESLIGPPKMVAPRPGEPKTLMYALEANPNPNPNPNPNLNQNPITLTPTRYALEAIS